ncbi:MAG: FIG137478: Hypothetical protein [uncultured Campylobacterales bacterium]|uniref:GTP cyclohydrolase 1 type 2 homolog n=1 Tax=uncultured Campylobacterales bacterium TaxID=352960 RepID=A0A6S6SPM2_9BACT|nr:MAG: FIG137478: Hypothetical protein [uncultured Campylobacterales bacterium]
MKLAQIYKILNEISPFELQDSWDNSGLIVGSLSDEVDDIYLSLEIDSFNIKEFKNNSLVIVHHPLIFKGIKSIDDRYPNNLLRELIKKNISVIAMHTNFDKTHFTKYIVKNVLKKKLIKVEQDYLHYFEVDQEFDEFLDDVSRVFGLKYVKYTKSSEYIKTAVILNGSGGEFVSGISDADCYLTGDIKYHQGMEARSNTLSLIDIRHYESEKFFAGILYDELKNFGLKAIISDCKNPFEYKGVK